MISEDTDHLRESVVERRSVYDGRLLHVSEDTLAYPSGRNGRKEIVRHPGAATIVALTDNRRVVLVRQWRHAAGGALWELPAGTLDPDEDPAVCAQRELSEETGYTATTWRPLGHGYVAPGYSTEQVFFFLATGLSPGSIHPDEDELLDVALFDMAEVRELQAAAAVDVKTIAGLAMAGFDVHV